MQARHAQRLEVAQRASRPQQEEELAWDDAEEQSVQSEQQPVSSALPEAISRASSATSETQQTSASEPNAAETAAAPASSGAHTPAMQVVPEESVVTAGNGSHGIEAHQEEPHTAASTTGDESATETVTSSESGSGNEHWTVVKSPSKQTLASTLVSADHTEAPNQAPAPQAKTAAAPSAALKPSSEASVAAADNDDNSEIDELDDVSNDGEVDTSGGPGSERDEDWGEWE